MGSSSATIATGRNVHWKLPTMRSVAGIILIPGVLLLPGCGGDEAAAPADPAEVAGGTTSNEPGWEVFPSSHTAVSGFVGSDACRRCHAEVSEQYADHPMAQSLAPVLEAETIEDYEHAEFSTSEHVKYYVERTPQGVWHHERRTDDTGAEIYDQAVPVDYAVGSGIRGRTYLTMDNGRMKASPISWYTQTGTWDLSPGYPRENHLRFDRQVSHGCLACHAGRVEPDPQQADLFSSKPFHEHAIGCERCHGPGQDHIVFQESSPGTSPSDDPIVNPAAFDDARRDAVCTQCHLLGERRVVRLPRTEFDFRPGEYLSDNWTVFLKSAGAADATAGAVSQVEQMYLSRCFVESDGALSCISCHDPHTVPGDAGRVSWFRDRCIQCHAPGGTTCAEPLDQRQTVSPDDSCIDCHMPSFAASDVHAAQTDHRILRRQPQEADPSLAVGTPTKRELRLFLEPGATIPGLVEERARGIRLAEVAYYEGAADLATEAVTLLLPVLAEARYDIEGRLALGQAFAAANRNELAIEAWKQVLTLAPNHEKAIELMSMVYMNQSNHAEAQKMLERLVDINPTRSHYFGRLSHAFGMSGQLQMSTAAAERALELNPSLFQTHQWLIDVYGQIGDSDAASRHLRILNQFRSTMQPAEPADPAESGTANSEQR